MRLMDENYQTKYIKWLMGQSVGYTGVPMSQEEAEKCVFKEMPEPYYNPKHNTSKREIYKKLGQLEDVLEKYDMDNINKLSVHLELLREFINIKNELGIDLETYFKTLNNGAWYKDTDGNICWCDMPKFSKGDIDFNDYHTTTRMYGVIWALTKEELL